MGISGSFVIGPGTAVEPRGTEKNRSRSVNFDIDCELARPIRTSGVGIGPACE